MSRPGYVPACPLHSALSDRVIAWLSILITPKVQTIIARCVKIVDCVWSYVRYMPWNYWLFESVRHETSFLKAILGLPPPLPLLPKSSYLIRSYPNHQYGSGWHSQLLPLPLPKPCMTQHNWVIPLHPIRWLSYWVSYWFWRGETGGSSPPIDRFHNPGCKGCILRKQCFKYRAESCRSIIRVAMAIEHYRGGEREHRLKVVII